jgi:hypothetical protein
MSAGILCERSSLLSALDGVWAFYRSSVLFFDFVFYVEIERRVQSEEFCCQAGVFAGIFCRAAFDVFFGFMDDKISEPLTVSPNQSPEPTRMTPSILRLSVLVHPATVPAWLSLGR